MVAAYKELITFLQELGLAEIGHTDKTYLGHLVAVHRNLEKWGCDPPVCLAGLFHSIYGTQRFQGFTLGLDRREELQSLIGSRGEQLAFWNCMMYRPTFDECVLRGVPPFSIRNRVDNEVYTLASDEFDDLCRVHLCDWLEQVPRCRDWDCRRQAYRGMAVRLGGPALAEYDATFQQESADGAEAKGQ